MSQTDYRGALFSELRDGANRLIRCTTPPPVEDLNPGDMLICETSWGIDSYISQVNERGAHVRHGRHRFETEKVVARRRGTTCAPDYPPALINVGRMIAPGEYRDDGVVTASTDAFAATWDALTTPIEAAEYVPAETLIPVEMIPYLPFPTLNPAQAQTAPHVLSDKSLMVVAPTGAGKTVIGMMAALREIIQRGGKAAWLVPQRSLTAELNRELDRWRHMGLKVVALSGESTTDVEATKAADLWVATTEKFESLCRASSMKATVASIGTLVVDEIHLLGEPSRGPVLESLLARVRGGDSGVRLVGLSATAANAPDVADWLQADLVEITWRPTRLTTQLLTLPTGSPQEESDWRSNVSAAIVGEVTGDGGATLVFCGTKAAVRQTAMAIARSRGVDVSRVQHSDVDAVQRVCDEAGVGIHYSDWPAKAAAERQFRDREIDVLVATSTLAAGVNTPARSVVVRDTTIGPHPMEVSMVQQMFGRAGRAGKEQEGWSYLLCTTDELGTWRRRLDAGYTIRSGILESVADHLLGEIVQGNIASAADADTWWTSTFAYHQGSDVRTQLDEALESLERWRLVTTSESTNGQLVSPTVLGRITSKMMVPAAEAARILMVLRQHTLPTSVLGAEDAVINAIVSGATGLTSTSSVAGDQAVAIRSIIFNRGIMDSPQPHGRNASRVDGTEIVRAGMMLLLRTPRLFLQRGRQIAGVNAALFNACIYETPRYLAWLAALGHSGSVDAGAAIAAADMSYRITHYRLLPARGAGRLLRVASQIAGPDPRRMSAAWKDMMQSRVLEPHDLPTSQHPKDSAVRLRINGGHLAAQRGVVAYAPVAGRWAKLRFAGGYCPEPVTVAVGFAASGDWDATGWMKAFAALAN